MMERELAHPAAWSETMSAADYLEQTLPMLKAPSFEDERATNARVYERAVWTDNRIDRTYGVIRVELERDRELMAARITQLEIGRADQAPLSLQQLLLPGFGLYSDSSWSNQGNHINYKGREIVIREPWSPVQLLTLFHEVGHLRQFAMMTEVQQRVLLMANEHLDREKFKLTNGELALILQQELAAWHFAQTTIAPFLDQPDGTRGLMSQRDAAVVQTHALATYKQAILALRETDDRS